MGANAIQKTLQDLTDSRCRFKSITRCMACGTCELGIRLIREEGPCRKNSNFQSNENDQALMLRLRGITQYPRFPNFGI
jgi:hypothetical protein